MRRIADNTLGNVSLILNGVADARARRAQGSWKHTYAYIQPIHLADDNKVIGSSSLGRDELIDEKYLVRRGDILVRRLNPSTVNLITQDFADAAVSSNLFIIRVKQGYDAAYVAFIIECQGLLALSSHCVGSGSAIRTISSSTLGEISMPALPLEKQKIFGALWLLDKRRKRLQIELGEEYETMMRIAIRKATKIRLEG
jgi:hypothetical protein